MSYDRKVILFPSGTARRETTLKEIEIPDLWHLAMKYPRGSREQKAILDTWHLAHEFKRILAEDE